MHENIDIYNIQDDNDIFHTNTRKVVTLLLRLVIRISSGIQPLSIDAVGLIFDN